MSWQAYIDSSLLGSGRLDKAAIYGQQPPSKWANSAEYDVKTDEVNSIVAAFADKKDPKSVMSEGIHIAGDRFVVIKADERSIYGKKGKEGIIIVKTKQAYIIGHHPDTVQTQPAASVCETLADYLIGQGY